MKFVVCGTSSSFEVHFERIHFWQSILQGWDEVRKCFTYGKFMTVGSCLAFVFVPGCVSFCGKCIGKKVRRLWYISPTSRKSLFWTSIITKFDFALENVVIRKSFKDKNFGILAGR